MLFFHQPFLISVDSWLTNWCSLEMQLKFFLDCLTAWWKVLLLCLLAIRQPSWRSKNELHWCLRESFIFNDLEMSFVWPWSFLDLRDTIGSEPLIDDVYWHENVCHDVVASCCLVLVDDMRAGLFEDDGSRHILANTRWVAPCFSSASKLGSWKGSMLCCLQHYYSPLICSSTSYEWVLLL